MRTIGRRYPGHKGGQDYAAMCDYCGVYWYRKKMRRDASGYLACPDDMKGRDAVTLARLNADSAATYRPVQPKLKRW